MFEFTKTIRGKIITYVYLSVILILGLILVVYVISLNDSLKSNAITNLRLNVIDVAEELNNKNIEALTLARMMALAQEEGMFGNRFTTLEYIHAVLESKERYEGAYICYEPDADGRDSEFAGLSGEPGISSTGRFIPYWKRDEMQPNTLTLESSVGMDSSLYYEGVKQIYQGNYSAVMDLQQEIRPSKHYALDTIKLGHVLHGTTHRGFITEPYLYNDSPIIEHVSPIQIDGKFAGVAGIDRRLSEIRRFLAHRKVYTSQEYLLVSRMGRIIASTHDSAMMTHTIENSIYENVLFHLYTIRKRDSVYVTKMKDPRLKKDYFYAGTHIDLGDWTLMAQVSEEEIIAPTRDSLLPTLFIAALGLLGLFPLLVWIANSATTPINKAIETAKMVAAGQLEEDIEFTPEDRDSTHLLEALQQMKESISYYERFRVLLDSIATGLIAVRVEQIDEHLVLALSDISKFIGCNRSHVIRYSVVEDALYFTHRWSEDNSEPPATMSAPYTKEHFPYVFEQMKANKTVIVERISDLPERAHKEIQMMETLGIDSFIMVPLFVEDEFRGALLFSAVGRRHTFMEQTIELLELAGYIFLSALDRRSYGLEILAWSQELELRVEERTSELAKAMDDLASVNKELESFSYSVSHDLRAPLRHISGFSDLLKRKVYDKLEDSEKKYFDKITAASTEMGTLIDDLLSFSRMGRVEMKSGTVHNDVIIQDIIANLEGVIADRDVQWNISELHDFEGDPTMIKLVWMNLISNALKFSRDRERTEITIGHERRDGKHVYFVKDNGVGFDPEYKHKLFGVFERLHSNQEFEGTGIGLANIRRIIVDRHDGEVWAESIMGEGATFYFAVPVTNNTQHAA